MSSTKGAWKGFLAALGLLLLVVFALFHQPTPPANVQEPLIKELTQGRCIVGQTGKGANRIWTLENRHVRIAVDAQTGKILEVLSKEDQVKLISPKPRKGLKPFGFTAYLEGKVVPPPAFTSKGSSQEGQALLLLRGKTKEIGHELRMVLREGSPGLDLTYTCKNLSPRPVEGNTYFHFPGHLGDRAEDDVMVLPGRCGLKKFDVNRVQGQCPALLHPFRGWFAALDRKSRELLVLDLHRPAVPGEEVMITEFSPTHYNFGFAREKLTLESGDGYRIDFSLTPLSSSTLALEKEKSWWSEVRDLYKNLDPFLDLPSGARRHLVADWGLAYAWLDSSIVKAKDGAAVGIHLSLNPDTTKSPNLTVKLLMRRYGSTETLWSETEQVRLGGFWRPREKTLSFSVPSSTLGAGRFDLEWQIESAGKVFHDRLNLGVAGEQIPLPPPDLETGRPLERVIARRLSQRVVTQESIDPKKLSYILHYAAGIQRNDAGEVRDTMIHPEFRQPGRFELLLYFVHEGAIYRYDKAHHRLVFYQMGKPFYASELEEEETLAYGRTRQVQAPVLLLLADGGGASESILQTLHLAAAAVDVGFCVFGDKEIRGLKLPEGYRQLYYSRLGVPAVPFLFEPEEGSIPEENMPWVDAPWSDLGRQMARSDRVPREAEMSEIQPNLPPIREHDLTLEEAIQRAVQVTVFEEDRLLEPNKKSQLLWAAYGRSYLREIQEKRPLANDRRPLFVPQGVHRTVPSACGEYLVDLYLVDETGVYQYFGKRHYLHHIRQGDFREKVCELLGSPFENPAALFLFARRDKMRFTPEGEGYEEACFSAQNLSLVAASMGLGIGFASVKPAAPSEEWAPILGKPEALERIPFVGGQDNIASPPARPFAVAAAGWPAEKDLRWRKAEDEPLAFAPPEEDRPEGSRAAEARSPMVDLAKELFPEARRFKPGGEEALYYIALKKSLKKAGMDASQTLGFAADTFRVVPEVLGYHGPIHIALGLNPYGRIKDLRIFDHTESEEHMNRILDSDFLEAFKGKNPGEMAGVDIVSGATVTCVAMARAIQTAQQRLCGATGFEGSAARGEDPGVLLKGAALAFFFTAAFCLLRVHKGWRLGLLLLAACFLGWVWNWSFTYTDLLTGAGLFGVLTALLITLVVVSTLLKGRIYCGWICPFGAVQELIKVCADRLIPKMRRAGPLSKQGQSLKFAVLLALIAAAVVTGIRGFLNPEPFSVFFGWNTTSWRLYVGLAALALSLVISRPFCRYLCPSGALLACLHRLKGETETHPAFSGCQGCGRCRRACPTSAVEWDEEENRVLGRNRFECIGCEECVKATAQGPCQAAREGRSV